MFIKLTVFFILGIILYCLASGLFYLIRQTPQGEKQLAVMLTWRVALSVGLFGFLLVAYFLGWIHPQLIMVAPPNQ